MPSAPAHPCVARHTGALREFTSRCYNLILNGTLGARFSDAQCGFKAVRASVARAPAGDRHQLLLDTELLMLAQRSGLRIAEVPVGRSPLERRHRRDRPRRPARRLAAATGLPRGESLCGRCEPNWAATRTRPRASRPVCWVKGCSASSVQHPGLFCALPAAQGCQCRWPTHNPGGQHGRQPAVHVPRCRPGPPVARPPRRSCRIRCGLGADQRRPGILHASAPRGESSGWRSSCSSANAVATLVRFRRCAGWDGVPWRACPWGACPR